MTKRTSRRKRHMISVIDESDYLDAANNLATKLDLEERYMIPYENDISIGGLYQRKKKTEKIKTKRINKKKRCKK